MKYVETWIYISSKYCFLKMYYLLEWPQVIWDDWQLIVTNVLSDS